MSFDVDVDIYIASVHVYIRIVALFMGSLVKRRQQLIGVQNKVQCISLKLNLDVCIIVPYLFYQLKYH